MSALDYGAMAERMAARLGPWGGPPPRPIHPLHRELSQRVNYDQGEDWDLRHHPERATCTATSSLGRRFEFDDDALAALSEAEAVACAVEMTRSARTGEIGSADLLITRHPDGSITAKAVRR